MIRNIIARLRRLIAHTSKAEVLRDPASRTSKLSLWQMLKPYRGSNAKQQTKLREEENICKNVIEKIFDQEKLKHIENKDANKKVNMNQTQAAGSTKLKSARSPTVHTTVDGKANKSAVISELDKNDMKVQIVSETKPEEKTSLNIANAPKIDKNSVKVELTNRKKESEKIIGNSTVIPQIDEKSVKIESFSRTNNAEKAKVSMMTKHIETEKNIFQAGIVDQMNTPKVIDKKESIEEKISTTNMDRDNRIKHVEQTLIKEKEYDEKGTVCKRSGREIQSPLVEKASENITKKLETETECAYTPSTEIDSILKAFGVNPKVKQKNNEITSAYKAQRGANNYFGSPALDNCVKKKNSQLKEKDKEINVNRCSQTAKGILENDIPAKEGVKGGRENLLKKMALETNTLTALGGQSIENSSRKPEMISTFGENEGINSQLQNVEKENVLQTKADKIRETRYKNSKVESTQNQPLNAIGSPSETPKREIIDVPKAIPIIKGSATGVNTCKSKQSAAYFQNYMTKPENASDEKSDVSEEAHSNLRKRITKINAAEYEYLSPSANDAAAKMRPTKPDFAIRDAIAKMNVLEFEDPNNPLSKCTMANMNTSKKDASNVQEEQPSDNYNAIHPPAQRMCPGSKEPKFSFKSNTNYMPGPMSVKPYNSPQLGCPRNYAHPECPAHPGWNYGCRYGRLCPFCMRYGLCRWPTCSMAWQSKSLSTPYTANPKSDKSESKKEHTDSNSGQKQTLESSSYKCQGISGDSSNFSMRSDSNKTCGIVPPSVMGLDNLFLKRNLADVLIKNYNILYEIILAYFKKKDVNLAGSVLLKGKKSFDPWSPMPSWPSPKIEKPKQTECPPGCKLVPLPKLKPIEGNPCDILPRTYGHGHADHFLVLMGTKRNS